MKILSKQIKKQLELTRIALDPGKDIYSGLYEFYKLIGLFFTYLEDKHAQEDHEKSRKKT